jgi:hypothetical protein
VHETLALRNLTPGNARGLNCHDAFMMPDPLTCPWFHGYFFN